MLLYNVAAAPYFILEEVKFMSEQKVVKIEGMENGPLLIHLEPKNVIAICRCGRTQDTKGFCDGSHNKKAQTVVYFED